LHPFGAYIKVTLTVRLSATQEGTAESPIGSLRLLMFRNLTVSAREVYSLLWHDATCTCTQGSVYTFTNPQLLHITHTINVHSPAIWFEIFCLLQFMYSLNTLRSHLNTLNFRSSILYFVSYQVRVVLIRPFRKFCKFSFLPLIKPRCFIIAQ
jgi:hypothetical protein